MLSCGRSDSAKCRAQRTTSSRQKSFVNIDIDVNGDVERQAETDKGRKGPDPPPRFRTPPPPLHTLHMLHVGVHGHKHDISNAKYEHGTHCGVADAVDK